MATKTAATRSTGSTGSTRVSRFTRSLGGHSSTYKCGICGKTTRETGDCESGSDSCRDCFTISGWENVLQDTPKGDAYRIAALTELAAYSDAQLETSKLQPTFRKEVEAVRKAQLLEAVRKAQLLKVTATVKLPAITKPTAKKAQTKPGRTSKDEKDTVIENIAVMLGTNLATASPRLRHLQYANLRWLEGVMAAHSVKVASKSRSSKSTKEVR